jgi:hypothetical protein
MDEPIVLQSGFIAIPNNNFVINPPTNEDEFQMRNVKFNNHIIRMQSSFAYHGTIDKLLKVYESDTLKFQDFDVQEQLYIATIDAFTTFSFKEWILLQTNNSHLLKHQKQFINDVYRIINGDMPMVSLAAWMEIIHATETPRNGFDTTMDYNTNVPVTTVNEFIASVLGSHNGINNLMMIMGIIFGNKRVPILY